MPDERRRSVGAAVRKRLLKSHTPQHRAKQLDDYCREVATGARQRMRAEVVA